MLCIIPTAFPVTAQNLNWTIVVVGLVLVLVLVAWCFPVWGARRWYRGKAHTLPNANVVRSPLPAMITSMPLPLLDFMRSEKDSFDASGLPCGVDLEFSLKPRMLLTRPGQPREALPPLPGRARSGLSAPRLPRIEDSAEEACSPH